MDVCGLTAPRHQKGHPAPNKVQSPRHEKHQTTASHTHQTYDTTITQSTSLHNEATLHEDGCLRPNGARHQKGHPAPQGSTIETRRTKHSNKQPPYTRHNHKIIDDTTHHNEWAFC